MKRKLKEIPESNPTTDLSLSGLPIPGLAIPPDATRLHRVGDNRTHFKPRRTQYQHLTNLNGTLYRKPKK